MISQIMKEMAEKLGLEIIELKLSTDVKPEDVIGFPTLNKGDDHGKS